MLTGRASLVVSASAHSGGLGSTTVVANLGWVLAEAGYKVLIVDNNHLDPSLHYFFRPFFADDLILKSTDLPRQESLPTSPLQVPWNFRGGELHLVLSNFPSVSSDKPVENPSSSRQLRSGAAIDHLRRTFDFIILDNSTGARAAEAAIAEWRPEVALVLFTLDRKTIDGGVSIAQMYKAAGSNTFPIPSKIDNSELERLEDAFAYARARLETFAPVTGSARLRQPLSAEQYWRDVSVPYRGYFTFGEILPVFKDPEDSYSTLTASTIRLASMLASTPVGMPSYNMSIRTSVVARFKLGMPAPGPKSIKDLPPMAAPRGRKIIRTLPQIFATLFLVLLPLVAASLLFLFWLRQSHMDDLLKQSRIDGLTSRLIYVSTDLGDAYLGADRPHAAIEAYKKALELGGESEVYVHAGLAAAYASLGQIDDAKAEIKEARKLSPTITIRSLREQRPVVGPAFDVLERLLPSK
jgi:tetratricopeptide (TPR) repeat protein